MAMLHTYGFRQGVIGGSYRVSHWHIMFICGRQWDTRSAQCVGRLGGLGSSGGKGGGGGYGDGKGGGGKKSVLQCFVKRSLLMLEPNMW